MTEAAQKSPFNFAAIRPAGAPQAPAPEKSLTEISENLGFVQDNLTERPLKADRSLSDRSMMSKTFRIKVRDHNILQQYCNERRIPFWQGFHDAMEALEESTRLGQR